MTTETSTRTRVLTGITTTGTPHLGNYVGAIRPTVQASRNSATQGFYFLADYHALIKCDEPARIQRSTLEIAASWIASGLDPEKVTFYRQSDIPEIPELTWLLTCVTGKGVLNRAHAYKASVDKNNAAGHDTDADTILGLDAGANDYVTKPFKFPVLLARIRAQLRTHEQSEDAVFQLGPYTFKPAQKMLVTENDKKVRLTEKETNILKFLYRASERVVPRDVLLHEVWGYNAGVTTHTLETHIYRLRQKIEPDPSNAQILVTESGGYRLVA